MCFCRWCQVCSLQQTIMSSTSSQEPQLLPITMTLPASRSLWEKQLLQGCNMNYLPFSILAVTLQLADVFVTGKGVLQCGCGTCSWCAAACRSSPARSTLSTEPSLCCRGAAARNCSSWSKACRPMQCIVGDEGVI